MYNTICLLINGDDKYLYPPEPNGLKSRVVENNLKFFAVLVYTIRKYFLTITVPSAKRSTVITVISSRENNIKI